MQEALSWMRSNGEKTGVEDIARLSPLMHEHINMLGHYTFTLPEDILKGEMRTLNFNLNNELSPYVRFRSIGPQTPIQRKQVLLSDSPGLNEAIPEPVLLLMYSLLQAFRISVSN